MIKKIQIFAGLRKMTRVGRNSEKRWRQQLSARKGLEICLNLCEEKRENMERLWKWKE
jgi:hypothetical protein